MNKHAKSLLKLAGVTAAIFLCINLLTGAASSDIHVHDTFIIIDAVTKGILFLIFSAFIGSLILSILNKFKNKHYNRVLLFSALLLISSSIYIFSLFAKLQ